MKDFYPYKRWTTFGNSPSTEGRGFLIRVHEEGFVTKEMLREMLDTLENSPNSPGYQIDIIEDEKWGKALLFLETDM